MLCGYTIMYFILECFMEELSWIHTRDKIEREETLRKVKEYILSLIVKKKSKKKEIEKVLKETPKQKETPEKKKSFWDKIKEKISWGEWTDWEAWWDGKSDIPHQSHLESSPEDQDEYIPHNSEFGESLWEANRFWEVYPPFLGYYTIGKKSYFNPATNLWSKKKQLKDLIYTLPTWSQTHTYAGIVKAWITALPLPDWSLPNTESLCFDGKHPPVFQIDQNNCVYLVSKQEQRIAFNFARNQLSNTKQPISEDSENIIYKSLSQPTEDLLQELKKHPADLFVAETIKQYILKNKKYSTKVQWTLREKSTAKNYLYHIDESPILECFSANTLFVWLCRSLWLKARLIVWHMVQSVSKSGKAYIGTNTGHARSEVWDEKKQLRVRFDATPTVKDEEEKKKDKEKEKNQDEDTQQTQEAENNLDEDTPQEHKEGQWKPSKDEKKSESQDGEQKSENEQEDWEKNTTNKEQQWDMDDSKQKQQAKQQEKSAAQLLDELIEKAKEDNLTQNAEKIQEVLEKIEQAWDKHDVKKALEEAWLDTFAKDIIDKVGNDRILHEEKEELQNIDDEHMIDQKLQESLLDETHKEKLKQYAKILKDKIDEQKRRMKSEMEKFGFKEHELKLYRIYKQLEKEVEPEVRKQIQQMEKILPPNRHIQTDEKNIYRSWVRIDWSRLADYEVTWDPTIFKRNTEVRDSNEINMFEVIIIDRSGSMGSFEQEWSIFRESVKAAIIRAKVLEHFKVDFSIIIFDDSIDEVMDFGEKFSSRTKCMIPSKLMKACTTRSWGNSQEPITYAYQKMMRMMKEKWGRSFGNVSFIGDGDLLNGSQDTSLRSMIQDMKKRGLGVTAYYINRDERKMPLISYYFWEERDGWTVYASDSGNLSTKVIESHRKHLKNVISKYVK